MPKINLSITILSIGLFFLIAATGMAVLAHSDEINRQQAALSGAPVLVKPVPEPEFDPALLDWKQVILSAPWQQRDSHAVVVYNNRMWLMAGLDATGHVVEPGVVEYEKAVYKSDVWVSDDGENWQLVSEQSPWGDRRSIQIVDFKGKMWLMGGWSPEYGYKNDIWSSEDGINWTRETEFAAWPAREGHSLLIFKDKIWLIGGVRYDKNQLFNDVWYSEDGINWTEAVKNAGWSARWDHGVAVFKDKLWLVGGMIFHGKLFNDVWHSEDGINWIKSGSQSPFMSRQGGFVTAYKDRLWAIGRLDTAGNGGINDVWYSDNGESWQKTNSDPLWTGREDVGAVVFKDKIWILGGMDRNWEWKNDVWYSTFDANNY